MLGVLLAGLLYGMRRDLVPKLTAPIQPVITVLYHKYYVDEFYEAFIRRPLHSLGRFLWGFDDYIIMGLVQATGFVARVFGYCLKPFQSGRLQGYGLGMIGGMAVIALFILWVTS